MRKTFKPTKSLLSLFSVITLLHLASPLRAAEFFVGPGGEPAGDGSAARPWDLQTALYHPTALKPGDILWLRGGTYRAPRTSHIGRTYFCTLNGTEANPILIKQYPGEATVVDGGIFCRAGSGWYQFWGFRITNTDTDRFITADSNVRATGLFLEGRGAKVINMVIDNVATPIFWGDSGLPNGDNAEIYGCIIYGGGVYDAKTPGYTPENPWVRGNALYTQNKNGKRYLRDNICFRNFTGGFMIYGEGGYANGLTMEGNIAFDPAGGAAFEATSKDHPTESITMLNNYAFSEKPGNLFWVGYQSENNQNATFIGNYGAGLGSWTTGLIRVKNFDSAIVRSNFLFCWGPNKSIASLERVGGLTSFPFDWDYNSYYSSNNTAFITNNAVPQKTFSEWKTVTGYDRHSSFANAAPTNLVYFTRRNKYDQARSHLVVFNWAQAASLNYDLALAGLTPGARFEIRDVQNYFGTPAVSGVYNGSPVAIPLTLTSVSPIVGKLIHFENKHTPRAFNTFVIINSPTTNPVPPGHPVPTLRTLTVALAQPNVAVAITVSPSDHDGQGNGSTSFTRTYLSDTVVTLSAPAMAGGNTFLKWQRNGVTWSSSTQTTLALDGDYTMIAVYQTPTPSTRTLTVESVNPNSGVMIAANPNDLNGQGGGTTRFTRSYTNNAKVTLTAPGLAGTNVFRNWQSNGVEVTTNLNLVVTLNGNCTLTAVYGGGEDAVGHWKFDDDSGTIALDSSDNGHHGRLISGPVFTSGGRVGGALRFDGTNDHVIVPDATSLDFNGRSFTVGVWVKTTKAGPQMLVEKQHTSFSGVFLLALNRDNVRPGAFSVFTGGGMWIDSNWRGATNGEWHHLAVVYDNGMFRLYRDGQLDTSVNAEAAYLNTSHPLNLGRFVTADVGWPYQGLMDDLRRYNRALPSIDIATLAKSAPTLRTLSVGSMNPNTGVTIGVRPPDTNGHTSFIRQYTNGSIVKLTAPALAASNAFVKWQRNAADYSTNLTTSVTLDSDQTLTAVYQSPFSPPRTLTVVSANSHTNVAIIVSPSDNHGAGSGNTAFTRVYSNNAIVNLTAPAIAEGNPFMKWQCDGVDMTTNRDVRLAMGANHTLAAVYGGGALLGWWRFDESGGSSATDSSGFGNHGSLTKGPVFTNGLCAGGLSFDGVDDFVCIPDANALDFNGGAFSVALIVKTTKSGPQALVEKQHSRFDGFFLLAINRDNAVPGGFSVWTGDHWIDSNWRGATDGQFHLLAVTYDGTKFRLYRDGLLDHTHVSSASYVNTASPLNLGRFATAGVGWPFRGCLDEVRRYSRALSDVEVAALTKGPPVAPASLQAASLRSEVAAAVPRISMTKSDKNQIRLRITGPIGQFYRIEASNNLREWVQLGGGTVEANGQFDFIDPSAATYPSRFYRAVAP